jgi:hypothetical protein
MLLFSIYTLRLRGIFLFVKGLRDVCFASNQPLVAVIGGVLSVGVYLGNRAKTGYYSYIRNIKGLL